MGTVSREQFEQEARSGIKYYDSFDYGLIRRYPDPYRLEDHYDSTSREWEQIHPKWRVNYSTDATPIKTYEELQKELERYSRPESEIPKGRSYEGSL